MNKFFASFLITSVAILSVAYPLDIVRAQSLSERLEGRILLEVEAAGEAWYLNPVDKNRYFLGRPDDAFKVMRLLGLGISEISFKKFQAQGAKSLKGRILLRVESSGEAYYVNPLDSKLYYLGRPDDAFKLMRRFGLGITNSDITLIPKSPSTLTSVIKEREERIDGIDKNSLLIARESKKIYNWRYRNQDYSLEFNLSNELFKKYSQAKRVYSYYPDQKPLDLREEFYAIFLKSLDGDRQTLQLLEALKMKANDLGFSSDERAAFIISFIQYLRYDHDKAALSDPKPSYPFETLYQQKGICSDVSFLAVYWLRNLGYGTAILDFPDSNHSALGIACPQEVSVSNSGYCYVEMTNYFPPGIVPKVSSNGKAQNINDNLSDIFTTDKLGKLEIKQASKGRLFQGVAAVRLELESLRQKKEALNKYDLLVRETKNDLDIFYDRINQEEARIKSYRDAGDLRSYNQLVPQYNEMLVNYQLESVKYNNIITEYQAAVNSFNQDYKRFYQQ